MPDAGSMKVLVVDDQQSMRALAKHCLTRIGVKNVVAVASAEAALKELEKAQFDVIVSDLNMEGMSGSDLLDHVRKHPVLKAMPFILATSERYKDQAGMDDGEDLSRFVAKPFSVSDLRGAIEGMVGELD